jgi:hypothetical protein
MSDIVLGVGRLCKDVAATDGVLLDHGGEVVHVAVGRGAGWMPVDNKPVGSG